MPTLRERLCSLALLAFLTACNPRPGLRNGAVVAGDGGPAADVADTTGCVAQDPCHVVSQSDGSCVLLKAEDGTLCGPASAECKPARCLAGVCKADNSGCKFSKNFACFASIGFCDSHAVCHPLASTKGTGCDLDDDNGCSEGKCDGSGNCKAKLLPLATTCDAADPCNPGFCSAFGDCVHKQMQVGHACGPANVCQPEACTASGTCEVQFAAKGTGCLATADGCGSFQCDGKGACAKVVDAFGTPCTPPKGCTTGAAACDDKGQCVCVDATGKPCNFSSCVFEDGSGVTCFSASQVNPCMAEPATWNDKGLCLPKILVGNACSLPTPSPCLQANSGVCDANAHCAGVPAVGLACVPTTTGPCVTGLCDAEGKCKSIVTTGKTCSTTDPCRPTGLCTSGGNCEAPIAVGAACKTTDVCRPTGTCDAAGTCVAPIALDKPCGPAVGQCFTQTCKADGSCGKTPTPGMPCKNDVNPCKEKGVCDLAGACTETIAVGAVCPTGNPCTKGACATDGHCALTALPGAKCPGGTCVASGQCAMTCTADYDCLSICGTGICGQDGFCSGSANAGKPAILGWDLCVASATCNEFGTIDKIGVADGLPCSAYSTCVKGSVCMAGHCVIGAIDKSACDNGNLCDEDACCLATDTLNASPGYALANQALFGQCLHKYQGGGPGAICGGAGCYTQYCYGLASSWQDESTAGCKLFNGPYTSCAEGCALQCHASSPCMLSSYALNLGGCPCTYSAAPDGQSCGKGLMCMAGECVLAP